MSEASLIGLVIGVAGVLVVLHGFAMNRRESDLMLDTYTRMLADAREAARKRAEQAAQAAAKPTAAPAASAADESEPPSPAE